MNINGLTLTSFSESPLHLLTILEAEMLKNVVPHSVATALASNVFPVPEGIHEVCDKYSIYGISRRQKACFSFIE